MPKQPVSKSPGRPTSIRFRDAEAKRIVSLAAFVTGTMRHDYIAQAAVDRARQDLRDRGINPEEALAKGAMAHVA